MSTPIGSNPTPVAVPAQAPDMPANAQAPAQAANPTPGDPLMDTKTSRHRLSRSFKTLDFERRARLNAQSHPSATRPALQHCGRIDISPQ